MRASFIIHKFEKVIVSIFNNTWYFTELQVNIASGPGVFRKPPLEIFASACGARRDIIVEFGAAFSPHQTQQLYYTENATPIALSLPGHVHSPMVNHAWRVAALLDRPPYALLPARHPSHAR